MKKVEKKERKGDRLFLSKRRLLFPYVNNKWGQAPFSA
jgi:hypothetical protein